jgi:ketosteroid isomerase-like protein
VDVFREMAKVESTAIHSGFTIAVSGADAIQCLFHQEKGAFCGIAKGTRIVEPLESLESIDRRPRSGLPSDTPMHSLLAKTFGLGMCLIAAGLFLAAAPPAKAHAQQQPVMPRSERHESRHEIDQLEEDWREALLKGNIAAMEALLADDYMAVTPFGMLQTKDQAISNLRAGHITTLELYDRKVRFYGTTAVVTSIARIHGATPDGDMTGSFRYTRVYVRDPQGKWKIVSFEASRMRDPAVHK